MTADEEYAVYERKRKRTMWLTSPLWAIPAGLAIAFGLISRMTGFLSDMFAYVAEELSRNSL